LTEVSEEEKKTRDFISELLDREWDRRIDIIHKTKKIEPDDVVAISVMTLNREMGEMTKEMEEMTKEMEMMRDTSSSAFAGVTKTMVTKDEVAKFVKLLKWGLGVGFTIVTIVISLITLLS